MADIADIADKGIEAATEDAIRRAAGKSGREFDARFDGAHCIDCEDEIPAPRLALGKVRCVECQTLVERRHR